MMAYSNPLEDTFICFLKERLNPGLLKLSWAYKSHGNLVTAILIQ